MNSIITPDQAGARTVLEILSLMKNKNDAFFKGTFNWLIHTHPPFPGSHIVFLVENNGFKHLKVDLDNVSKMNDLKPGDLLQELRFIYTSKNPYHVIVGRSEWINILLKENASPEKISDHVDRWINYYHENVNNELKHFRSLIETLKEEKETTPKIKPLF